MSRNSQRKERHDVVARRGQRPILQGLCLRLIYSAQPVADLEAHQLDDPRAELRLGQLELDDACLRPA